MFRDIKLAILVAGIVATSLSLTSCGKSSEDKDATTDGKRSLSLTEIARRSMLTVSLDDEGSRFKEVIEAAGYVPGAYDAFPTQEVGKKGRMLVYAGKDGKSGGVMFVKKVGNMTSLAWHWYFGDMVPERVEKYEMNEDGLWDLRITGTDGRVMKFIQDTDFTLMGLEREDWIAMNGDASPSVGDEVLWRCFDGDTTTAWRSTIAGPEKAFVDVRVPFGVKEGILSLKGLGENQPRRCVVYADGKKLEELDLAKTSARQTIRLNASVSGAKNVRLVFESAHDGDVVAIAELALQ
ncbi:MAG: hypothetical protein O7D32_08870 [bacterium]|nr:hypothetical protein [bacterium]